MCACVCDQRGTKKGRSGAGASSLIANFQVTGLETVAYKPDFMMKRPSSEGVEDSMKLRTTVAIRKMRVGEGRVMWSRLFVESGMVEGKSLGEEEKRRRVSQI